LVTESNDRVVTLKSQLDLRAQKEVVQQYGFYADHAGILENSDALEVFNFVLESGD